MDKTIIPNPNYYYEQAELFGGPLEPILSLDILPTIFQCWARVFYIKLCDYLDPTHKC